MDYQIALMAKPIRCIRQSEGNAMKNYDVTALGELLIDFTESGISSQGNPLLNANIA